MPLTNLTRAEVTGQAQARPRWEPDPSWTPEERRQALLEWERNEVALNPDKPIDSDIYEWRDGQLEHTRDSWIDRNAAWFFPAAVMGGGLGLGALGAYGGASAAASGPTLGGGQTLAANLGGTGALGAGGAPLAAGAGGAGAAGLASILGGPLAQAGIPAAMALLGRAMGGAQPLSTPALGGGGMGNANLPPEFQQLLAEAMKRMSAQAPLAEAINAQAMGGLPTIYQKG
jgi:hypothetical protein